MVSSRRRKYDVDIEIDLHGHTVDEMRSLLEQEWPGWQGMICVRLVHGRGVALKPALQRWCSERGIPIEPEPNNPGSALIFPTRRLRINEPLSVSLRDKGLSLTSEQDLYLRDPEAARKAKAEELARRQAEQRRRQLDATALLLAKRRDEAMWQAELDRLGGMERRGTGKMDSDFKPPNPVVRQPSEIKHQEGWWNAELVRVADTDTDTLKVQKRTGLDKLAPPITAQKPESCASVKPGYKRPARDTKADQELFEAEIARLDDRDGSDKPQ